MDFFNKVFYHYYRFVRVSVDEVIIGDALLPVPVGDELVYVKHALNGHVRWPKKFVMLRDVEVTSRKPLDKSNPTKEKLNEPLKPNKEEHKRRDTNEPNGSKPEKRIKPTRSTQSSIDSFEDTLHLILPERDAQIKFPIGVEIFGEDIEFSYLPKADILDVVHMKDLKAIILMTYM
ncbi:hypothetical protein FRX31_021998, partial [Thalictrum thalictroides]